MIGFTLPLYVLLGVEGTVGLFLLLPKPFNRPAAALCKWSNGPYGNTVVVTVASFLALLLLSPLYEQFTLHQANKRDKQFQVEQGDREAQSQLSLVLDSVALITLFMVRRLGNVLSELDRKGTSEQALLKQVKGLSNEYNRLLKEKEDSSGSAHVTPGQDAGLQKELDAARKEKAELQEKLDAAEKAKKTAENNMTALKTQCKGLENEYDRLLSEVDTLKRRLSRTDASYAEGRLGDKKAD